MKNAEGYADDTAGFALYCIKQKERMKRMREGQKRCAGALDMCLGKLKEMGFRVEGEFKVTESSTGIYLKTKR